ncbi:hypothetical protein [Streptomyces sp. NPDC001380]|uniref:hypothetical protein n=1 Tax=Streptomyces sp. NPDC001380 TaxID=3364566 RepID=UPI00367FFE73
MTARAAQLTAVSAAPAQAGRRTVRSAAGASTDDSAGRTPARAAAAVGTLPPSMPVPRATATLRRAATRVATRARTSGRATRRDASPGRPCTGPAAAAARSPPAGVAPLVETAFLKRS